MIIFTELGQIILKFIWNHKYPKLPKQSWEKRTKLKVSWSLTSDPAFEVSGGGWEELPHIRGQGWPGGDTPRPRSGAARRSHLAPEARGGDPEEPPRAQGQGGSWEELPMPESRACGREEQPEEWWLRRHRRA